MQFGQLCVLCRLQVVPQRLDQGIHAGLLPFFGHGVGAVLAARTLPDPALQPRQLVHGPFVQNGHVRQLCHLCCRIDQPRLYILVLAGPQQHLVQLCRVLPDAAFQFIHLPCIPRPLHPLFRYCLRNGNIFVPLLSGCFNGKGIPLRLFLLPCGPLTFVIRLPFHDLIFLHDQAVFCLVRAPLLLLQLPRQLVFLAAQFLHFQLCLVQHLLPLGFHAFYFLLHLPLIAFPQECQLLVQVAHVCNVRAQCFKVLIQQLFCFRVLPLQFRHLLQLSAPACGAPVLRQPASKLPLLYFLHALQTLFHLGSPLLAACGRFRHLQAVLLDPLENGLRIGHLRRVQDVSDHPACQLHLHVLIFRIVRKPAHCHRLDGIVQVHQYTQPLRAFHAPGTIHARLLCGGFPQRLCTVTDTTHRPVIVDHAFILFRRVSILHAVRLPQAHAVLSRLGYSFTPAAVGLHQLCLCLPRLVHGVFQLVQFRVFVPQFAIAVGRPVQHLARQRLGQRFRLVHVRTVGFQVLHQYLSLPRKFRPVHLAAVCLCPAACQPFNGRPAHLHAPCQPKELAQGVQRCSLVRNGAAGRLLIIPFCIPVGLLCQLIAELCKVAFLYQFTGLVIFPDLPHYAVSIHTSAVFLAGCHPTVCCGDVQCELPFLAAQLLHHSPDLFQLLRGGCCVCREIHSRCFSHHAHIAVQQKFVQRFRSIFHLCRTEHAHDLPVIGISGLVILGKVQHLAVRQNVPGSSEVLCRAKPFFCQYAAVFCLSAVGFGLGIIYRLFCFAFFCVLLLHPGTGLFDPAVQHSALVFQLRHTGIVVFALCKIILVFFAVPVGFCFCRKNPQCLLFCLDLFHGVAS